MLRHDSHDTGLDSNMGVDIWPWIFPPLRGDVSACTRQWARSGRGAASRIARHGQRSGYACGYGHGNRNGLARSRASFFMVKALFCSTYSTSIVEEEPRAVFLHLFRGVVFLSFSAFSGRWFELFTVTFRRVQRFYVCKRRLRGQPQLSIMGQEYHLILTQSVCEVVTVQNPYAIVPTLVLYFFYFSLFPSR